MARPNLVTGQVFIPSFNDYLSVNPTADLSSGSPNITNITDVDLLYPGLVISNALLPAGTTVLSVDYPGNSAVLSQNSSGGSAGTTLNVVFPSGFYHCPVSLFSDANGIYNNNDIRSNDTR